MHLTKKTNLPWLTSDLKRLYSPGYSLREHASQVTGRSSYKKKRNKAANLLKRSKVMFFSRANPSDPKSFWKTVKVVQKKESQIPFLMSTNGDVISDNIAKDNLLNNFFCSCFNHKVPSLSSTYGELLDFTSLCTPQYILCTEDEVEAMLLSLDSSKASGPDNISARMLKFTATSIAASVQPFSTCLL